MTLLVIVIAIERLSVVARSSKCGCDCCVMLEPLCPSATTYVENHEEHDGRSCEANDEEDSCDSAFVTEEPVGTVVR